MFLLSQPSDEQVRNTIAAQWHSPFSYPFAGASRDDMPREGYKRDYNRVRLGHGRVTFDRAVAAMRRWRMFDVGWMHLCWPDAPIAEGTIVALVASSFGLWTLNACRVIYTVDEDRPVCRYGFAYGTLPEHVARGEERFLIEWDRGNDAVWYSILAFSQPNQILARAGYPVTRLMQKRFASDSKRAMLRAVTG